MPWKVNGRISDEKKFLQMIEYDARPIVRSNGKGYTYTPAERSEIMRVMGEKGYFKEGIQAVMRSTVAKDFRKQYMQAVNDGLEPNLSKFTVLHRALDKQFRIAILKSAAQLPNKMQF